MDGGSGVCKQLAALRCNLRWEMKKTAFIELSYLASLPLRRSSWCGIILDSPMKWCSGSNHISYLHVRSAPEGQKSGAVRSSEVNSLHAHGCVGANRPRGSDLDLLRSFTPEKAHSAGWCARLLCSRTV